MGKKIIPHDQLDDLWVCSVQEIKSLYGYDYLFHLYLNLL